MKKLIPEIIRNLKNDTPCTLAFITRVKGSSPRGAGAAMLVYPDGACGTIGGGLVEHQATIDARRGLVGLAHYSLTQKQAAGVGMVCGGNMDVCFWPLTRYTLPLWEEIERKLDEAQPVWLVMLFKDGEVAGVSAATRGRVPFYLPESALTRNAHYEKEAFFVLPVLACGHCYVFGGGHVAQQLTPLLAKLDFSPVVFEDRPEFATRELFPDAQNIILGDFSNLELDITADDQCVIMTRGHVYDQRLLSQVLRTPANYIGLIGSRGKIAHTKSLLFEEGFTQSDFDRVHTPIGLDIKAQTPIEIAVSIAAEMILHRAQL
ncbi:MAG: XdhC family protein [Clostridia bacterium]|nr:XdhC family protein [Clostridia bacterium]